MAPQTSYARGTTIAPLLRETIGQNLTRTVTAHPDRDALVEVSSGRRWTYREFVADVARIATGLLDLGIRPGDRVGIWSPNTAEWTLVQYATAQIGAVLVTINPAYRVEELDYVLNQAGIRTVIAASSFKSSDYASMLETVRDNCPALHEVIIVGTTRWNALAATEASTQALGEIADTLSPDDPINIQYTSGTTGFPKGATLTHANILNNGFFVGEGVHYSEHDRVCIPVPFYHCFGMVMGNLACTSHGAAMVIPHLGSTLLPHCVPSRTNTAPRCTGYRRCSSPNWPWTTSTNSISVVYAPGSWPAHLARNRSCAK